MKQMLLHVENCGEHVRWKRTGDKGGKRDRTIDKRISSLLGGDEVEKGWEGNSK
jgi:hypothetical protein